LVPPLVRPVVILMLRVLSEDLTEVSFTIEQEVVEALAP
jgi:hypothetical protein